MFFVANCASGEGGRLPAKNYSLPFKNCCPIIIINLADRLARFINLADCLARFRNLADCLAARIFNLAYCLLLSAGNHSDLVSVQGCDAEKERAGIDS